MMKIISSFLKNNSVFLTPKSGVSYNIFTYMLTTSQSRSHYLYFIDVGNEEQKKLSDLICHVANLNLNLVLTKSKSFALEL